MKIVINHNLPKDAALKCSKEILEHLRLEHEGRITNVVEMWTGNKSEFSFRFKGMSISGSILVNPENIEISGRLPMAAMLFTGIIEDTIRAEASKMLVNCNKTS